MTLPFMRFQILENSMVPFLHSSDVVLVFRYIIVKPKVGDVIILKHSLPPFILCKRIKKKLGDNIWVEGDNKVKSVDSRSFGFVNVGDIIGKVIWKL